MKFVYVHRRKDNNRIFYIGKGNRNRHKCATGRSKNWNLVVAGAGGFIPEIILDFLTEDQSCNFESELIEFYKDDIVNVQTKSTWKDYSEIEWSNYFKYDENSQSKLANLDGSSVGWINSNYWNISLNKVSYRIHRIVWLLFNNDLAKDSIVNHIDCNSLNNSISNLEVVTHRQNVLRSKRSKGILNSNNTSGHTNIFREKYKRKDGVEVDSICALVFQEEHPTQKLRVRVLDGDVEDAINIAKEWQQSIINGTKFENPKRLNRSNKTGHNYICKASSKKKGKEYYYILCQPPDKPTKQFSILKYGYDEALRLAIDYVQNIN